MSKSFRGIPVKGWIIVTKNYRDDFEKEINNLMETYNFEDFQFSVDDEVFYAAILVSEKKK